MMLNPVLAVSAIAAAAGAVWSYIGANAVGLALTAAAAAYSMSKQRQAKKRAEAARREAQRRAEEARRIALSRSQVAGPGHFSLDGTGFSQYNSASTNFRDSITPRRIVYGTRKLGGPILFAHNTEKTVLHIVVALAAHEVEEIGSVWVGKEEVTLSGVNGTGKWGGRVRVEKYLGTLTQNVGTSLIALGCKNVKPSDKWKGLAVLQIRATRFSQKFEGSPEFSAMVKGKKDIFDPRSNTHGWTDNSALIVADYLHEYMGVSYADIDIQALRAAADVCDELVPLKVAEGEDPKSEKRYTTNIAILHAQDHERSLNDLVGAMAGNIALVGGKWVIRAGAPITQSAVFTLSDIIDGLEVTLAKSQIGQPEGIKGTYQAPVGEWEPATYPVRTLNNQPATSVTNWLQLDLPATTSAPMAQRLAKIEFLSQRLDKSLTITTNAKGLTVVPGDVIGLEIPQLGWTPKQFEIVAVSPDFSIEAGGAQLICNLELSEYNPDVYAWDREELPAESAEVSLPAVEDESPGQLRVKMTRSPRVDDLSIATDHTWTWADPGVSGKTLSTIDLQWEILVTMDDLSSLVLSGSASIAAAEQTADLAGATPIVTGTGVLNWVWSFARARARYSGSYDSAWVDATLS